jgi:16S rRNA (cytidine1402-2'-O)-methyltransferase
MGILYLVSTPIGNLEDITFRAVKTLLTADIVLCEDTRRSGMLLNEIRNRYASVILANESASGTSNVPTAFDGGESRISRDYSPQLISFYDQVEDQRIPEVIEYLKQDKSVALISDAGTPLVSDPGFKLVQAAIKRNIPVVSIPGPSAILAALTSSGLPPDKFMFLGYLPEKPVKRMELFNDLSKSDAIIQATYIFFCAPHKLLQTLADLQSCLGDIRISLARELTKVHEEVWNGTISEAMMLFSDPKGEFVLLFHL